MRAGRACTQVTPHIDSLPRPSYPTRCACMLAYTAQPSVRLNRGVLGVAASPLQRSTLHCFGSAVMMIQYCGEDGKRRARVSLGLQSITVDRTAAHGYRQHTQTTGLPAELLCRIYRRLLLTLPNRHAKLLHIRAGRKGDWSLCRSQQGVTPRTPLRSGGGFPSTATNP